MRELIRKIFGKMTERTHAVRKKFNAPIKVVFPPSTNTGQLRAPGDLIYITGETHDLSKTGVAFIVSSIRVRENYLVGQDRRLHAEIDLPDGKIKMTLVGRRYERVGLHLSTERFLIGAEIVEISNADREAYDHFLRYGIRRKKATEPNLGLGGS